MIFFGRRYIFGPSPGSYLPEVQTRVPTRSGPRAMSEHEEHFSDDVFLRFVRGILPPEQAQEIQGHVDRGCRECLRSLALWRSVLDLAGCETEYEVPEGVLGLVKAAFLLRRRIPVMCRLAQAARLVFDSLLEPLPEGIRAGVAAPQHLLHEAGGFLIDLWLEIEGARRVCLAGQVVSAERAAGSSAGTAIVLVQGNSRLVAMTLANALGEFHLKFRRRRDLTLYLDVPAFGAIMVPLAGFRSPGAAIQGIPPDALPK